MEIRRAMFGAVVRLGIVLSTISAFLAIGLDAVGHVSPWVMMAMVAAVGFVTSWVLSGRAARSVPEVSQRRVTVIALRHPVG